MQLGRLLRESAFLQRLQACPAATAHLAMPSCGVRYVSRLTALLVHGTRRKRGGEAPREGGAARGVGTCVLLIIIVMAAPLQRVGVQCLCGRVARRGRK